TALSTDSTITMAAPDAHTDLAAISTTLIITKYTTTSGKIVPLNRLRRLLRAVEGKFSMDVVCMNCLAVSCCAPRARIGFIGQPRYAAGKGNNLHQNYNYICPNQ